MRILFILSFFIFSNLQAVSAPRVVSHAQPITVANDVEMEMVNFSRIVIRIPSTKVLGKIKGSWLCNNMGNFTLEDNNFTPADAFFADKFVEEFSNANYNIARNQTSLFNDTKEQNARFLIAGMVVDMEADVCFRDIYNHWTSDNKIKGSMYLKIDWQVYDIINRSVVYNTTTEGYHNLKKAANLGYTILFEEAYAGTVKNLLSKQKFYNLFVRKELDYSDPDFENILVNYNANPGQQDPISLAEATNSVVTIKSTGGHGSGFVISQNGYILTNQHVVGADDKVTVTFSNEMEVEGNVIRSATIRDAALVKIPLSNLKPLPLKLQPSDIGSRVFAIGAPMDTELSGSISSDIVSTYRKFEDTNLVFLQSDTIINGGNSGGPLVNEFGQVIAIVVSKRVGAEGISFFIPIDSALNTLSITQPEG